VPPARRTAGCHQLGDAVGLKPTAPKFQEDLVVDAADLVSVESSTSFTRILGQSSPTRDASTTENQATKLASPETAKRASKPEVKGRGREATVSMRTGPLLAQRLQMKILPERDRDHAKNKANKPYVGSNPIRP